MATHKQKGRAAREKRKALAEERKRKQGFHIPVGGLDYGRMSRGRLVAVGEPMRNKGRRSG